MVKIKLLPILILSFFLFSFKSLAVPYPEYINWLGSPRDYVISLYEGIFGEVIQDQGLIYDLASTIDSNPQSRLDLFWRIINSTSYQNSTWAGQIKEYQVYYEYIMEANVEKYHFYVAKNPTGADMFTTGLYTFGVAMALRDFKAVFVERSIEYGVMWNFVPQGRRNPDPPPFPRGDGNGNGNSNGNGYGRNSSGDVWTVDDWIKYYNDKNTQDNTQDKNEGYTQEYTEENTNWTRYYDVIEFNEPQPEVNVYRNGKKDGIWLEYHLPDNYGNRVLASRIEYNNGVKVVGDYYDSRDFLSKRIKYHWNGNKSEVTAFYDNGRESSIRTYDANGTRLTYKAWYRDGREK